jgi:hypothetical protein
VRKKLTLLLTTALIAVMIVVASAAPAFGASGSPRDNTKKYCVYYRGFHFVSAKQFHKHHYKKYPKRYCNGQAPGLT